MTRRDRLSTTSVMVAALQACVALPDPSVSQRLSDSEADPAPPTGDGPTYWQHVEPLLRRACIECHAAQPLYGAPMSLAGYRDLLVPSFAAPYAPMHQLVAARIRGDSGRPPMPPRGGLSEAEIALIAAWSAAGAPEGAPPAPPPPAAPCGDAGVEAHPAADGGFAPDAGSAPPPEPPPAEDEVTVSVLAPGAYIRTGTQDEYGCFRTIVRTDAPLHALEIVATIDQPTVVHHVLLFRDSSRTYPAEKSGILCALDTVGRDWELLHGWAPGGDPMVLPPEAGVRIEDGEYLIVQIHYNNVNGAAVTDRSGMSLRATRSLRPNDAAVVGFGTESFLLPSGQAAISRSGDCTITQPTRVFAFSPHMHLLGRGARVERIRGGASTVLADITDFAFEQQVSYPADWQLEPGDVVRTTCTWNTTTRTAATPFGEGTADEMCYVFASHYPPIGAFSCTN